MLATVLGSLELGAHAAGRRFHASSPFPRDGRYGTARRARQRAQICLLDAARNLADGDRPKEVDVNRLHAGLPRVVEDLEDQRRLAIPARCLESTVVPALGEAQEVSGFAFTIHESVRREWVVINEGVEHATQTTEWVKIVLTIWSRVP